MCGATWGLLRSVFFSPHFSVALVAVVGAAGEPVASAAPGSVVAAAEGVVPSLLMR